MGLQDRTGEDGREGSGEIDRVPFDGKEAFVYLIMGRNHFGDTCRVSDTRIEQDSLRVYEREGRKVYFAMKQRGQHLTDVIARLKKEAGLA